VLPDKKYFIQVSALMACFILAGFPRRFFQNFLPLRLELRFPQIGKLTTKLSVGLWAPQLASTTMGFGFLSAMGFLYNRGTPDVIQRCYAVRTYRAMRGDASHGADSA
jgi:hypothetical protein